MVGKRSAVITNALVMIFTVIKRKEFSMEVVNFYPQKFSEIPKQDNPALDCDDVCLMIVGADENSVAPIAVHYIMPSTVDTVTHLAQFWVEEKAVEYCEFFASKYAV